MSPGLKSCIDILENSGETIYSLIHESLVSRDSKYAKSKAVLREKAPDILHLLACNEPDPVIAAPAPYQPLSALWNTITTYCEELLKKEVNRLTHVSSGFHANARRLKVEQLENLSLITLHERFSEIAPTLMRVVTCLLDASGETRRWLGTSTASGGGGEGARQNESEDPLLDEGDLGEVFEEPWEGEEEFAKADGESEPEGRASTKKQRLAILRNEALIRIKSATIASTLMQSSNRRCNVLQATVGLFFQSVNAPERIVNLAAHGGWATGSRTNDGMVDSLEKESMSKVRRVGKEGPAIWGYDNTDWEEATGTPTLNKDKRFISATTATFLPLKHGVTWDDLKCRRSLWAISINNPRADQALVYKPEFEHLFNRPTKFLERVAWHLRYNLLEYSESFGTSRYRPHLGQPPGSDIRIPVTQTNQFPARMMNIKQSTVDGNIEVLENLKDQIGCSSAELEEHVVLVHGDLGTMERVQAAQFSRGITEKAEHQLSSYVFVPGLFHLEMAAADAMYRMYIAPEEARSDPTSLYNHAGVLRPKDILKIKSKPSFRQMHDVLHHVAGARSLDILERVVLDKFEGKFQSLDEFGKSEPEWTVVVELSMEAAKRFIPNPGDLADGPGEDTVSYGSKLLLRDMFLYVELAHAMKWGDIGRVEEVLFPWIEIFAATGKHKYAAQMLRFLMHLRHVYPPGLQKAVRMSWLCNPTGKEDGFRGVDWLLELNNLYTKIIYGKSVSGRDLETIIKRSPLIEIFRHTHTIMENNFFITPRTMRHAKPNMRPVIQRLLAHMKKHNLYAETSRGGDSKKGVEDRDRMAKGNEILMGRLDAIFARPWDLKRQDDEAAEVPADAGFAIEVSEGRENLEI